MPGMPCFHRYLCGTGPLSLRCRSRLRPPVWTTELSYARCPAKTVFRSRNQRPWFGRTRIACSVLSAPVTGRSRTMTALDSSTASSPMEDCEFNARRHHVRIHRMVSRSIPGTGRFRSSDLQSLRPGIRAVLFLAHNQGQLASNPVIALHRLNSETGGRRTRRAPIPEEIDKLMQSARSSSSKIQCYDAETRTRIYVPSCMTGLRKGKRARLTVRSAIPQISSSGSRGLVSASALSRSFGQRPTPSATECASCLHGMFCGRMVAL